MLGRMIWIKFCFVCLFVCLFVFCFACLAFVFVCWCGCVGGGSGHVGGVCVGGVYVCDSIKGSIYFWRFLGLFGIKLFLHFKKNKHFHVSTQRKPGPIFQILFTLLEILVSTGHLYISHNPWSKHD